MAELILTEEEKAADSYLAWDEAALGKLVKHTAQKIGDDYGQDASWTTMAAHMLVDLAERINATTTSVTLEGATKSGRDIGDWKITVKQIRKPEPYNA